MKASTVIMPKTRALFVLAWQIEQSRFVSFSGLFLEAIFIVNRGTEAVF